MYRFEFLSESAKANGMLVSHAFELPCVFAVKDHPFSSLFFAGELEETQNQIIRDIHTPWINFVKQGDPDPESWPLFRGDVPPVRVFDRKTSIQMMDRRQMMILWGDMRFYEG
ncbi:MAG TPA: hypothetical protein DCM45_07905 [Clostridiales bacterium]|nr:hypothetical protein [Clostridiales bacterium]